jgi:hypothetical protein
MAPFTGGRIGPLLRNILTSAQLFAIILVTEKIAIARMIAVDYNGFVSLIDFPFGAIPASILPEIALS